MEFNEEQYIKNVLKELNDKCQAFKGDLDEWEIDDLNLDYNLCRDYCYSHITYNGTWRFKICLSCKEILEEKIRKPFNRTPVELNMAINKILGLF